jgi:hypothetical protein
MEKFDLEERLIKFSVTIVDIVEALQDTRVGKHKTLIEDIPAVDQALNENNELISIVVSSVMTAQRNLGAQGISNIEQGVMK